MNIENNKFNEFKVWFDKFHDKYGGFRPMFLEQWFQRIDKTHEQIRKILGGERAVYNIELNDKNNDQLEKINYYADLTIKIVPNYLSKNDLDRSVFINGIIQKGTHDAIKLTKHLSSYASDNCGSEEKNCISRYLSELGALWEKQIISDISLEILVSTEPSCFVSLGHYSTDVDSCFRQNGSSQKDKYAFAQTLNTCVILIKNKSQKQGCARCLGFSNDEFNHFNIINYYFKKEVKEGDTIAALKALVEKMLKKQNVMIKENIIECKKDDFYKNKYFNLTFADNVTKVQQFKADQFMIKQCHCTSCGRTMKNMENITIKNNSCLCESCSKYN